MSESPEGWALTTMGSIGKYVNGRAFKESDWSTTGRPIIRIQNLTGSNPKYNHFNGEVEDRYIVREGDLLFSWAATLGTYFWKGEEAVLNQHIFRIESKIDPRFHKYLLDYKIQELYANSHGSGMVHITKSKFDALPVSVPPQDVQQRIVETLEDHLNRLDKALADLKTAKSQADALMKSFAHSLYPEGLSDQKSVELGDACALLAGPAFKSQDFGLPGSGIRLLRGDNIEPGSLRWTNEKTWDANRLSGLEKYLLDEGDLILAMDRPVISTGLKLAVVTSKDLPSLLVQRVARLRPRAEFLPAFIELALQTPSFTGHLFKGQTGGGVPHINMKTISSFRIPCLSVARQEELLKEFDSLLSLSSTVIADISASERDSRDLRRSLLHAAFTGQLTNEEPND